MKRVETLRRMGLDWAADLIEALQRDKTELKAEIERLRALLKNKGSPDFGVEKQLCNAITKD